MGQTEEPAPDYATIGPLRVQRLSRAELSRRALAALAPGAFPLAVAFCNAHTAEIALRDRAYRAALDRFLVVNDGVGLEIAVRLLEGRGFPDNLNGTDFVPSLFGDLTRRTRLYLLGAQSGVAEEAGRRFVERFPLLEVVGARDGFGVVRDRVACKPAVMAETDRYIAFGSEYRALVGLPGIEDARIWEPEPATVYFWDHGKVAA